MENSVGGEGGSTMGTLKLFLGNFWPRNKYYPQIHIRVDRNCQPTWVTQNAIPEEQELILRRGGHDSPPPYRHRVKRAQQYKSQILTYDGFV